MSFYDPPPVYGAVDGSPFETTALQSGLKSPRRTRCSTRLFQFFGALLVVIFVAQNLAYLPILADDLSAAEKAQIRREWAVEKHNHQLELIQWHMDRADHRTEALKWEHARQAWPKEREAEERRRQALRDAFDEERKQDEHERQEARDNFNREWEAEERRRQNKRAAFKKETEEWERQREQEEQRRKDIERRRQGTHWSELVVDSRCYEYGTRAYEARLLGIPEELDWREVCDSMPIEIHGRRIKNPRDCHRNDNGDVWAKWLVNFDEPQCVFYWGNMRDLGCTSGQTGTRRFESRLMNLHDGDDWDSMCSTTPATIRGTHFAHPTACEDRDGRTGVWHVPDTRCDFI